MQLHSLLYAAVACASLASCASHRSDEEESVVGIWYPIRTDYANDLVHYVEFTGSGETYLYDASCTLLKSSEFIIDDGRILVGSKDPKGRFPPAIFYLSNDQTELISKGPFQNLTTTYGKTTEANCRVQG